MKTKQINFDIKELTDSGTFSGYGNTFDDVDHVKDVSLKGCFKKSLEEWGKKGKLPKMLWQHDVEKPIGVYTKMVEDANGLYIEGKLALNTQLGRETYELMKIGAIDSFSIGYRTIDEEYSREKGVNYLKELKLFEVSIVTMPCNENALLADVKNRMYDDELPTLREVQKLLQQNCSFSKRQAESTMNQFETKCMYDVYSVIELLRDMPAADVHKLVDAANAFLTEVGELAPEEHNEDIEKANALLELFTK